jgi:tetratricopeptide (TPR) repeat protein
MKMRNHRMTPSLALAFTLWAPWSGAWAQEPPSPASPPAPGAAATPAPAPAPAPDAAPAPDDPTLLEQARTHYLRGEQAYMAGDYDIARAEFEKANRLVPRPALLYNLARVAMKQKKKEDALGFLERYLATNPSDAEEVRRELNDMDPEPPPPPVAPPPPVVTPPPPPPVVAKAPRWPYYTLIGLGGAALLSGVGLATAGGTAVVAEGDAAGLAQARTLQSTGVYLLIGGAALAAGGVAAWALQRRAEGKARVALVPAGAGALLVGRF